MKCPPMYNDFVQEVRKCSCDENNKRTVVDKSDLIVCFDEVKEKYASHKVGAFPCSVDGLFIDECSDFVLVEFKSGSVDLKQFVQKIYDSSLILIDQQNKTVKWLRENVRLILVHAEKDVNDEKDLNDAARRKLFKLGTKNSSQKIKCFCPPHIVGFFLKDYEYLTPEQFISKYCD